MKDCQIVRISLLLIGVLFSVQGITQHHATLPVGWERDAYKEIPLVEMEVPENIQGDTINDKNPLIASHHQCSLTPENSGSWKRVEQHYVWSLRLRSKGAKAIAIIFSDLDIGMGDRLYIYNASDINGFSKNDIPISGVLPVSFLAGDEIALEYHIPLHAKVGSFTIERVAHAYVDIGWKKSEADARIANCYLCLDSDSLRLTKRSVVKIIAHRDDGTLLCTGTLVNNTANDGRPYILTAEHCIANENDASRSIFIFNFDHACNTSDAVEIYKSYGATLLSSSYRHDVTLVELNDPVPLGFRPYYAGWDLSENPPSGALSIHHPGGAPKQVSTSSYSITSADYDETRATDAFWKVNKWDTGITEGGSSGAPLFNNKLQVVGTLTGGSAQCELPYNDYFQKLASSVSGTALHARLDPLDLNVMAIDGMDPFDDIHPSCSELSNIADNESTGLEQYPGGGYFSGFNSDDIASYAEKFFTEDSVLVTGASFSIGSINPNAPGGIVVALCYANDDGVPGTPIYETWVPYTILTDPVAHVAFFPYVKMKGEFFITYTMSYSAEDAFAVNQVLWRTDGENTAWMKLPAGWTPLTQVSPGNSGTALDVTVHVCEPVLPHDYEPEQMLICYPNPATTAVICKGLSPVPKDYQLHLIDAQGRRQSMSLQIVDDNIVLDIAHLTSGLYMVVLTTAHQTYISRLIKN